MQLQEAPSVKSPFSLPILRLDYPLFQIHLKAAQLITQKIVSFFFEAEYSCMQLLEALALAPDPDPSF